MQLTAEKERTEPVHYDTGYKEYVRGNRENLENLTGEVLPDFPMTQAEYIMNRLDKAISGIGSLTDRFFDHGYRPDENQFLKEFDTTEAYFVVLKDNIHRMTSKYESWHAEIEGFDTDIMNTMTVSDRTLKNKTSDIKKALYDIELILKKISDALSEPDMNMAAGLAYYCSAACILLRLIQVNLLENWKENVS